MIVTGMQDIVASGSKTPFRPAPASVGPFGIYFGWYNVAISLVCIMLMTGATNYSFGLFVKPAGAELGLSRANTNVGLILYFFGSAIMGPIVGNLLDRAPLRLVLRVAAISFGLSMACIGLTSSPLLMALLLVGPLPFGSSAGGALFGSVLNSRWFTDRRGRALSIMAMGTSFGGLLVFPTMALFMSLFGWRIALICVGSSIATIMLVMSFLFRSEPDPETEALLEERAFVRKKPALNIKQILLIRDYWLIGLQSALLIGVEGALSATMTPYILDRGFSLAAATGVMSTHTASALAGKLVIATIADRADLRVLMAITGLFAVTLCATLLAEPSYAVIIAVSAVVGIAIGGTFPLMSALTAQRFGAPSVGRAMGLMGPMTAVSAMTALYFVGAVHDRTGNYHFAFLVFGIVAFASVCLTPFISRHSHRSGTENLAAAPAE